MASFFRDFSFDAPSRQPKHLRCETTSPTSMSPAVFPARPPTAPPCDINELAYALGKQDLRLVVDVDYNHRPQCEPLTPPSDDDTFAEHLLPLPQPQLSTARMNSATLRMQRQANVRMQSCTAHVKDIASLVEKMIQVEDQCNIYERKPKSSSGPLVAEDEGVDMDYEPTAKDQIRCALPFYRAGDRMDGGARVSKRPRMRKSTCSLSKLNTKLSR